METVRTLAEKIVSRFISAKNVAFEVEINNIADLLEQFAKARVKAYIDDKYPGVDDPQLNARFHRFREEMGWFAEKMKTEGFLEFREKAVHAIESSVNIKGIDKPSEALINCNLQSKHDADLV